MMKRTAFIAVFSLLVSAQLAFAEPLSSTLKDQQDLAVTIYNSNIGLVKDTRLIDLKTGVFSRYVVGHDYIKVLLLELLLRVGGHLFGFCRKTYEDLITLDFSEPQQYILST